MQKEEEQIFILMICETKFADNLFSMNGPMIYKMARKTVYKKIQLDLENNNLNIDDIDLVVPHKASGQQVVNVNVNRWF